MFELIMHQPTPVSDPVYQWQDVAMWNPTQASAVAPLVETTRFTALSNNFLTITPMHGSTFASWAGLSTQTHGQAAAPPQPGSQVAAARGVQQAGEVDRVLSQRMKLLAAKYGGRGNPDVLARLVILSGRLTEKAPTVTTEQVTALEVVVQRIDERSERIRARAQRLGVA